LTVRAAGEYDGTTRNLVELKTNMAIRPGNRGDEERFEKCVLLFTLTNLFIDENCRKTLRIWTQSFLLGIPTVNVGFRSPQGVVRSVQTFDTASFPRHVRGKRGPGAWDASIVLGWGARALELIRRALADGVAGEDAVWRAEFTPGCGLKVRKLEVEEIEVVQQDGEVERVGFLPKWYLDELRTGTPTPDRAKAESGVNDGRKDEIAPSGTPSPDKLLNEAPESAVAEQTL
jgi:RAT1-interacting protein